VKQGTFPNSLGDPLLIDTRQQIRIGEEYGKVLIIVIFLITRRKYWKKLYDLKDLFMCLKMKIKLLTTKNT